ncbi:MAG TPA: response regulator transcription factor [Bryobacteraceae bacterium]|nr:response regulator transcription factor [Bryobacteraceae bacterium]
MANLKVLNVDDEPQARRAVKIALVARGVEVLEAATGLEAIAKLHEDNPDVVILDVNMPGMNGIETCRVIRTFSDVPVIVLSVRKVAKEKAEAFEAGADQYISKPFDVDELIARIHAVKRRTGALHSRVITLDDVEIDLESHEVKRQGMTIHLTAKEFKLLNYLAEHAGAVVTHRRLLQAVWGPDYGDEVEYLRVFINQVRKKIEPDPRTPRYLLTEPSMGYRLVIRSAASGKP